MKYYFANDCSTVALKAWIDIRMFIINVISSWRNIFEFWRSQKFWFVHIKQYMMKNLYVVKKIRNWPLYNVLLLTEN